MQGASPLSFRATRRTAGLSLVDRGSPRLSGRALDRLDWTVGAFYCTGQGHETGRP